MKEEIIKLLENIELNNEEGNENFKMYEEIKKDFEYAINKIKESNEDLDLYEEIKEEINKANEQKTDFRKYRVIKNLSTKIIAIL